MDTYPPSIVQVQNPAPVHRRSRRFPRRGAPLRWGAGGPSKRAPRVPSGGNSGNAPPAASQSSIPQGDAVWLASLRPWAIAIVDRLGLRRADREDAVQEAFAHVAVE